ncbi:peptidase associated/transthyretin-like domain-containing protein [Algoriphagus namhaensis]
MKVLVSTLFFLLSIAVCFSQSIVRGKIVDDTKKTPVFGVNILVKSPVDSTTIAFGFTNESGQFEIAFNSQLDSVFLIVKSMTIQEKQVVLSTNGVPVSIEVTSAAIDLKEFTVDGIKNPITQKNDTISYDVSGFATANDRVLSDVLKRLPGIEVMSNGMIQYQGKPLIKFYIEGLDLLQGRYNLANNNLPIDAIESVDLLENHQPIKVLDSLVFSDRAALNINLKRKNTWIGTGSGGVGGTPILLDAKLAPMVFREDFQALFTVQANNTGETLENQQRNLTLDALLDLANNRPIKEWFTFPGLVISGIPKERARFNESLLGSANALSKNGKETEFRLNIDFYQESLLQEKSSFTSFLLPDADTITFAEGTKLDIIRKKLSGGLNWNKNTKRNYFDNLTAFEVVKNEIDGNVFFNQNPINEVASMPMLRLENKMKILTPVNKKLFDIRSTVSFQKTQQALNLNASENIGLGNDDQSYDFLGQSIDFQRFFTTNSIGWTLKPRKEITIQSSIGISALMDKMSSSLSIDSLTSDQLSVVNRNSLDFTNLSTFVKNSVLYKKNGFQVKAELPFYVSYLDRNSFATSQSSNFFRVYLEPSLSARYQISGKVSTSLSFTKTNEFGTGEDYFPNAIVTSFRNVEVNESRLPESVNARVNFGLNYKNPVNGLFLDLNTSYAKTSKNVIDLYSLADFGGSAKSVLDFENETFRRALSFRGSKYLSILYTTLTVSSTIQVQDFPQVINGVLLDYSNRINTSSFIVAIKPKNYVGFDLKTNLNLINSESNQSKLARITQLSAAMGLEVFPIQNHLFRADFEYVSNEIENSASPQRSSFLDFSYRFTPSKSRVDFSLVCTNILDVDVFRNFSSSSFILGVQEVPLRPRQLLLKVNFSF